MTETNPTYEGLAQYADALFGTGVVATPEQAALVRGAIGKLLAPQLQAIKRASARLIQDGSRFRARRRWI
jgi:hypothetical protein